MSRRSIIIVVIALLVIAGIVITYILTQPQQAKKVLKVGTSPDFPPFEYINETTGEIVGIDIDLIRLAAQKLGYEVEIVSIDFDGLIPALQSGQIDVIASGMTITPERAQLVDFTTPYWNADQAILVVKGGGFSPGNLSDLAGKKVGVQTGTTAETLLSNFINETGVSIDVKSYTSYILAVQDLINNRLDAVIVDSPVADTLAKLYNVEIASTIQTQEKYGFAVRKGNTELLNSLNTVLSQILSSSDWDNIIRKYLG